MNCHVLTCVCMTNVRLTAGLSLLDSEQMDKDQNPGRVQDETFSAIPVFFPIRVCFVSLCERQEC